MRKLKILKTNISELTLDELSQILLTESKKTVAVCNANSLVRSYKDADLQNTINSFDICTPDGFPVAMASRLLYRNKQQRVDGFKIFNNTLIKSENTGVTHYFFGNTEEVVMKIINKYKRYFPGVNIVGFCCPPFLNTDELASEQYFNEILELEPDVIWFSLGFPKQEKLINLVKQKYSLSSNLVGIGFTFDWTAGTKYKAPELLANIGLEWLFRLIQEPKRLYKRYLIDNSLFILYFLRQAFFKR
mgnify:FL=1